MIAYLIKSLLCLLVLGSFYKLFLEKEKVHNLKRYYLILSIVFAYSIPLVTLTYEKEVTIPPEEIVVPLEDAIAPQYTSFVHQEPEEPVNYVSIFLWSIYGLGVIVFGFRFLRNLFNLNQKVKDNERLQEPSHINVLLGDSIIPHTFLKYIFVPKTAFLQNDIPEEVLFHERAHVQQKHTLDILFVEVLQVVFWFNPLLFWIKKSIKLNHEFLADQTVLKHQFSIQHYINLLVSYPGSPDQTALTSTINYSLTKKRLQMMTKEFSRKRVALRLLAVIPVLLLCVLCFNNEIVAQEKNNWQYSKTTKTQDKEIEIRVKGEDIRINGSSVKLSELAKTIDEITQNWKEEELKGYNFDVKLQNVDQEFVDKINRAYKATRLYKSNPDKKDLVPPPPPAPIVKKGEVSNIPPPPPPVVKKGETSNIPPPPPPTPSNHKKTKKTKAPSDIPTPPSPPQPPTKNMDVNEMAVQAIKNAEVARERAELARVDAEKQAIKALRDAERAEREHRKNAIAGITDAEKKHVLAAERVHKARRQAEEARALAAEQAEKARRLAEERIVKAKEMAERAQERAMLDAEEARRLAEVLAREAEQKRDRERAEIDEALARVRKAREEVKERREKRLRDAQIAREKAEKASNLARQEALLSMKLERERMRMERANLSEKDRQKLKKELKKLETLNRKEIEKLRKKYKEATKKFQEEQKARQIK